MTTTNLLHQPLSSPALPAAAPRGRRWNHRLTFTRARSDQPSWARPALFALLALTALAYIWNLSESGYANSFYAAAVQAGTKSWKAFFFGSIDSSNFITVDKPPASLWVMDLSGRIFGFSSWSMLVPQALEGVAAVALLYAAVKRWFGPAAGLAAGAVFAATPVAALMFRFNNPDALLVLMLVASAYCMTRALEHASIRWMAAVGAMIGIAFLAKMMEAFLIIPGLTVAYLIAAPTGLRRRILGLLAGGAALLVTAGWWVAIVVLWPASSRPFIDGSPDNSILNLITGYNGLSRIFGSGGGGATGAGGGGGANFSGATGVFRLFDDLMGGQASWLLPAALLALVVGLWQRRRAPRTDRTRAALLLWGGWLLVTAVVFSFSKGVIHTYYTIALAPAIGALVAIGGAQLWQRRAQLQARAVAAVAVAATGAWAYVLLDRAPTWEPWLRPLVVACADVGTLGLLAAPIVRRYAGRAAPIVAVIAAIGCMAGPVAYAADAITTAHTGSIPSAGPTTSAGGGGFGGGGRGGAGGFGRGTGGSTTGLPTGAGAPPTGGAPGAGGPGGAPTSTTTAGTSGTGTASSQTLFGSSTSSSTAKRAAFGRGGFAGGGAGGGGGSTEISVALKKALEADASSYRWVAATSGSQSAATIELATGGDPVMAIGGFNGEGGNLTLAQFESYVAKGDIHYYLATGGGGAGPGGGSGDAAITTWVESHFKAETIGGTTVYKLTQSSTTA